MEQKTVTQEQFTKKEIEQRNQYIPIDSLTLYSGSPSQHEIFISVSHDDFSAAINSSQNQERLNKNTANHKSELAMIFNDNENNKYTSKSVTHGDFGVKSDVKKLLPIRHCAELQIIDPNGINFT